MPAAVKGNVSGSLFDLSSNLYYGSISTRFGSMFTKFVMVNISINYLEGAWPLDKTGNDVSYWLNCLKNAMNQRSPDDCLKFYRDRGLPYDGNVIPSALPSDTSKKEHLNLKVYFDRDSWGRFGACHIGSSTDMLFEETWFSAS